MAGTINLALSQQFDMDGRPLSGGLLFTFVAGTSTPQLAFQDVALSLPHPNPIVLDASGRIPMFYLADGNIKIRLADKNGNTITAVDQLLVIGPSSTTGGGGGGAAVDPTTVAATGDVKSRYDDQPITGWVRCNGNSIGQASGSEAFGAQCQALFEYLWHFTNITLNVGKGANAHADWLANRTLNLPDMRGRVIAGMDAMGASSANRLTAAAAGFAVAGTVVGNASGGEGNTLALTQIPGHIHNVSGNTGNQSADHQHTLVNGTLGSTSGMSINGAHTHDFTAGGNIHALAVCSVAAGGSLPATGSIDPSGTMNSAGDHAHTLSGLTGTQSTSHTHGVNIDSASQGGGQAHANVQPTMVLNIYIKL